MKQNNKISQNSENYCILRLTCPPRPSRFVFWPGYKLRTKP